MRIGWLLLAGGGALGVAGLVLAAVFPVLADRHLVSQCDLTSNQAVLHRALDAGLCGARASRAESVDPGATLGVWAEADAPAAR